MESFNFFVGENLEKLNTWMGTLHLFIPLIKKLDFWYVNLKEERLRPETNTNWSNGLIRCGINWSRNGVSIKLHSVFPQNFLQIFFFRLTWSRNNYDLLWKSNLNIYSSWKRNPWQVREILEKYVDFLFWSHWVAMRPINQWKRFVL